MDDSFGRMLWILLIGNLWLIFTCVTLSLLAFRFVEESTFWKIQEVWVIVLVTLHVGVYVGRKLR